MTVTWAPGPDGIGPDIAKAALREQRQIFLDIANRALREGKFPDAMKEAQLVLLPKPAKNKGDPIRYRPISLLNVFGKVLEAMIEKRLSIDIEAGGGLHANQYGFRRGRSTIGAMSEVVGIAREATRAASQHQSFCVLVTLDVKNAFNMARWSIIVEQLQSRWNVEGDLVRLVRSYLRDRVLLVGGNRRRMALTCGVPQGSVLGPLLWNVFYDAIFDVEMPDGVTLVGYADDLAVVAVDKSGENLRHKVNTALVAVTEWLGDRHLQLATEKTEVVLLSGRRRLRNITVRLKDTEIKSQRWLKYLGVIFDKDLRMTEHVRQVASRASEVAARLCRLMPNVGGPGSSKRRSMGGVINSIILYGAPIWCGALKYAKYTEMLLRVQRRMALRVCSSYRTVSLEAALMVAGMIPIDLLVEERTEAHRRVESDRHALRQETMTKWQTR